MKASEGFSLFLLLWCMWVHGYLFKYWAASSHAVDLSDTGNICKSFDSTAQDTDCVPVSDLSVLQ